jgi:hypothetical protein
MEGGCVALPHNQPHSTVLRECIAKIGHLQFS